MLEENKIMSNLHCLHVIREISKFCHREMRNGQWNITRLEVVSRGRLYSDLLVDLVAFGSSKDSRKITVEGIYYVTATSNVKYLQSPLTKQNNC